MASGSSRLIALLIIALGLGCGGTAAERARVAIASAPRPDFGSVLLPVRRARELRVESWGRHAALLADGHVFATNGEDVPMMAASALLPLLAHADTPDQLRCATVGFGSGIEASALAGLGCGTVDVYEAHDDLAVHAAALAPLVDDRLVAGAAPFALHRTPPAAGGGYDVLVQPFATRWTVGEDVLYTVERLQRAAALLRPGGVMAQVVPVHFVDRTVAARLLRTIAEAFPHVMAIAPSVEPSEVIVLASRADLSLDLRRLETWSGRAETRRWTERAGMRSPWDVIARGFLADREELIALTGDAPPATESDPLRASDLPLGPRSPRGEGTQDEREAWEEAYARYAAQFADSIAEHARSEDWPHGRLCPALPGSCDAARALPSDRRLATLAVSLLEHGRVGWLADALEHAGSDVEREPTIRLIAAYVEPSSVQPSFDPLDPMPAALASNEELVLEWSERAGGSARLAALLNDVVEGGARSPEVMLARLIAVVLAADGRDTLGPADDLWLEHESYCEQHRETWYWLSRAYQQAGRGPASVDALARFLQVGPYAPAAHGRAAGPQHAPAAASEPRVR